MPSTSDRVRDLIRDSGLSQHDFAMRVGLDGPKLSKALSEARRFSSLDLARIAKLCNVTVDWLITGEESQLAHAARTTGGSATTAVRTAQRLATMRSDLAELGYPQPWRRLDMAPGSGSWATQGAALADAALAAAARAGRTGVADDLPELVESVFGADVAVVDLEDRFDGLATSSDTVKLIVLGTSQVPGRQRFTLAHELGHLLACDDQEVHIDEDVYAATRSREPSEVRANAFAAAFLMPETTVREALRRPGSPEHIFAALACDLRVSPMALAVRIKTLRLLDAGGCDRLGRMSAHEAAAMVGRGADLNRWTTEASLPRPPGLLALDALSAYRSGATTLRPYANVIGKDVERLRRGLEVETEAYDAS
jgi:Zn-dependent peptidase ImmA (M78 family)